MSEPKRVPLQTLETKKDKKGEKAKQLEPSFRFNLTLPESNEETYPEFNYAQLFKSAEKKRRKELEKRGNTNTTNGLSPFDDDDDDDKLRDMARRYEAKYGATAMRKKSRKYDGYVDMGAGYDVNDSFIDNTEAYDEIVPEEVTTVHGGFYINSGALEFKARHSFVNNNNNIKTNNDEEESSESSEEDAEETDKECSKVSQKHRMSSSEDEDNEADTASSIQKKRVKLDESVEKKLNHIEIVRKKKRNVNEEQGQDVLNRRKEKQTSDEGDGGTAGVSEDQDEKKKGTVEKAKVLIEKKPAPSSNGIDTKKLDFKKLPSGTATGKESNVDDAIESVVNAGRIDDESSRDTTDSGKSCGKTPGTESECDDIDKEEAPLPEQLPDNIKDIVNNLKCLSEKMGKERKTKMFNTAFNTELLSLEKKLRGLNAPATRMQTYCHLAQVMKCTKSSIDKRVKKLYLHHFEDQISEPVQRLKTIIDNTMPYVIERYTKKCQRVADEKGLEGSSHTEAESSDGEDNPDKTHVNEKGKIPRKSFPWNDETRKVMGEITLAIKECYHISRRKESMDSFLQKILETKVLPLWPQGWMKLQTLIDITCNESEVINLDDDDDDDDDVHEIAIFQ